MAGWTGHATVLPRLSKHLYQCTRRPLCRCAAVPLCRCADVDVHLRLPAQNPVYDVHDVHCVRQGFLIFLPFSSIAIVIVFVAIFCKWKKGIYAFILASVVLFVSFPPSLLPPCVFATLKAADR